MISLNHVDCYNVAVVNWPVSPKSTLVVDFWQFATADSHAIKGPGRSKLAWFVLKRNGIESGPAHPSLLSSPKEKKTKQNKETLGWVRVVSAAERAMTSCRFFYIPTERTALDKTSTWLYYTCRTQLPVRAQHFVTSIQRRRDCNVPVFSLLDDIYVPSQTQFDRWLSVFLLFQRNTAQQSKPWKIW